MLGHPGWVKRLLLRKILFAFWLDELIAAWVIIDTSNEIAGDGDILILLSSTAGCKWLARNFTKMIEVETICCEAIVIDEIGTNWKQWLLKILPSAACNCGHRLR